MTGDTQATPPLIVTDDERVAAVVAESFAARGWEVVTEFGASSARPHRIHVGAVRSESDARHALRLASRGAGLVVIADPAADAVVVAELLDDLSRLAPVEERRLADDPLVALEPEERELLGLLAAGTGLAEAARRLYVSPRSLDRRLSRLRAKLGVRTTAEALALAARSRARSESGAAR